MDRTLIYTCCNEKYTHFIPLFCAAALWSNSNIDIEIGVDVEKLSKKEEEALNNLRQMYPDSKIVIHYKFFRMSGGYAVYRGKTMLPNTVRFVSEPTIRNKYTYISDIDIPILEKDFYNQHIENMHKLGLSYSNIVRKGTRKLSGLHFCMTNKHYPLSLPFVRWSRNDEELLFEIVKNKGLKIDTSTTFRPVHGIHFSLNRPTVEGAHGIPGWGAKKYKDLWDEFKKSEAFKTVEPSFHPLIKQLIKKLEEFYNKKEDD